MEEIVQKMINALQIFALMGNAALQALVSVREILVIFPLQESPCQTLVLSCTTLLMTTDNVIAHGVSRASMGAVDCGAEQIDVACDGSGFVDGLWERYPSDCTDPTDPTDPTTAGECYNVKAFDTEWNSITTLSSLVAGDVVRFTVSGNTNSGSFSKARFTINGTLRSEVSAKRPGTEEFYDEYTIPEGVTTFTINAEIYHSSLGWF